MEVLGSVHFVVQTNVIRLKHRVYLAHPLASQTLESCHNLSLFFSHVLKSFADSLPLSLISLLSAPPQGVHLLFDRLLLLVNLPVGVLALVAQHSLCHNGVYAEGLYQKLCGPYVLIPIVLRRKRSDDASGLLHGDWVVVSNRVRDLIGAIVPELRDIHKLVSIITYEPL